MVFMLLMTLGIIASGYLEAVSIKGADLMCPLNMECSSLTRSAISHPFGVRLSWIGFCAFAALIALFAAYQLWKFPKLKKAFTIATVVGWAISVGLTAYGILQLSSTCFWCLLVLSSLSGLLILNNTFTPEHFISAKALGVLLMLTATISGGTVVQLLRHTGQSQYQATSSDRSSCQFLPKIGRSGVANYILVADFSCPHCRERLHDEIASGQSFYFAPVALGHDSMSRRLIDLFVAARRQNLERQFLSHLPTDDITNFWISSISNEVSLIPADRTDSNQLSEVSAAIVKRHGIVGVPSEIWFPKK